MHLKQGLLQFAGTTGTAGPRTCKTAAKGQTPRAPDSPSLLSAPLPSPFLLLLPPLPPSGYPHPRALPPHSHPPAVTMTRSKAKKEKAATNLQLVQPSPSPPPPPSSTPAATATTPTAGSLIICRNKCPPPSLSPSLPPFRL